MSAQMAFFAAARLTLPPEEIKRIIERMREFGADIDLGEWSDAHLDHA